MKIYVCYTSIPYEGCSEPKAAFLDRAKADAWATEHDGKYEAAHWEELELE